MPLLTTTLYTVTAREDRVLDRLSSSDRESDEMIGWIGVGRDKSTLNLYIGVLAAYRLTVSAGWVAGLAKFVPFARWNSIGAAAGVRSA